MYLCICVYECTIETCGVSFMFLYSIQPIFGSVESYRSTLSNDKNYSGNTWIRDLFPLHYHNNKYTCYRVGMIDIQN